jgi:protection-of-telomeres protein 1
MQPYLTNNSLPREFIPLRNAASAANGACFLGIIIETREVFKRDDDWFLEFTIRDHLAPGSESTLRCCLQKRQRDHLPPPGTGKPGEIAILRRMKIETRNSKPIARSVNKMASEVAFFPLKNIPAPAFAISYGQGGLSKLPWKGMICTKHPTPAEQMAIIHFKDAIDPFLLDIVPSADISKPPPLPTITGSSSKFANTSKPPPPASRTFPKTRKQADLKDMDFSRFYDLVGEVVKTYAADYSTFDLYVTDYTTNKNLFLYEDKSDIDDFSFGAQKNWPGPFGQMTMAIRLWDPHASWARENIREGDVVFLQNIHAKISQANKLEGAIHQDRSYPDRINVHKCNQEEQIAELKQRKEAYENEREKRMLAYESHQHLKKPAAKASANKKETKKEKQRLQKELEQQELKKQAEELSIAKGGINRHGESGWSSIFRLY